MPTGRSRRPAGADVVIEAEAIGVNYPDGLLVQGLYQMKPPRAVRAGHGGGRRGSSRSVPT